MVKPKVTSNRARPKDTISTKIGEEKVGKNVDVISGMKLIEKEMALFETELENLTDEDLLTYKKGQGGKAKLPTRYYDLLSNGKIINDDNADRQIDIRIKGEIKDLMRKKKRLELLLKKETDEMTKIDLKGDIARTQKEIEEKPKQAETLLRRIYPAT